MKELEAAPRAAALESPGWTSWTLLALGVLAASLSPILIRYASDADPLAIAFWRCAGGVAALAPFATRRIAAMSRRDFGLPVVAGAFLAVHFATWITSLGLTTVASSVVLVSTTPLFVAVIVWVLWRDRLRPLGWAGIAFGLMGTALVGGGDLGGGSLGGDALALLGGAAAAGYVLAGQRARIGLGILEYAVVTYAVSAALLALACAVSGTALAGYHGKTWWALAGLLVGPQLLGHTIINLVLKDIDATRVSMSIMAEPVVATTLAFILFSEVPSALVYPGGAAILAGIYLVSLHGRPSQVVVE